MIYLWEHIITCPLKTKAQISTALCWAVLLPGCCNDIFTVNIFRLYIYWEVQWWRPLQQFSLLSLLYSHVLFKEAVDKRAKDESQDHTTAEDHHLFLRDKMRKDTEPSCC